MENVWKNKVEQLVGKNLNLALDDWRKIYEDIQEHITLTDPISSAAEQNQTTLVQLLIMSGYSTILNNYHALFTAAENDNSDIVRLVLDNTKVSTSILNELFLESIRNNSIKVIKLLLEYSDINPCINDNQPILLASASGFSEIVHLLIKNGGVNPSLPNNKALFEAVNNRDVLTVEELLKDNRVNPGVSNNELVKIAIKLNYISIFEILINDSRVNPAGNNNELIIFASTLGRNKHIEELLKLDSNLGINPSVDNNAAIIQATTNNHYDAVKELLTDVRVDPHAQNDEAIMIANKKGYLNIADLLKYGRICRVQNKYEMLGKMDIFKYKVKDTLGGLVAGYYLANSKEIPKDNAWISSLYDYPESMETTSTDMFSYRFILELITNKTSMLAKIHTIKYLMIEWPDTKYSIGNAASSIVDPSKIILNSSDDLYGAIRGILLLCFRPQYSFVEIINMLKKEGNAKESIRLAGRFIGTYLGLDELIDQGLEMNSTLDKYINKILSRDIIPLMMQYESTPHQY